MLFQAVMKFLSRLVEIKFCSLGNRSIVTSLISFFQQVTCEDILDDLRDVFKLFINRTLFLDCLLVDPVSCYAALSGIDLPYVEENTEQAAKGKKKDGRR
jgi:hypothetical protein